MNTSRVDTFIIWSTGIPYLNEIMSMLRDKFEIIMIHKHIIKDLPKFVDDVYSCDSYPLEHLKAKTKYLLEVENICFLVLVRNHHVNEQLVGEPPYRKPQCLYLHKIKNEIRNKFNPSFTEHVIHGTDYESQVDHILNVFNLNNKEYYTRELDYPWPWHLPVPKSRQKVMVSVSELGCNILGDGIVSIYDTPHYAFVKGDRSEYETYHGKHRGVALKEDHFSEAFDKLINEWSFYEPIIIQGKTVLDGVHRLAILAQDHQSIRAYHVNF